MFDADLDENEVIIQTKHGHGRYLEIALYNGTGEIRGIDLRDVEDGDIDLATHGHETHRQALTALCASLEKCEVYAEHANVLRNQSTICGISIT